MNHYLFAKGTGIDQIWLYGNEYLIVEAKGPGVSLSLGQMSRNWVASRLISLTNSSTTSRRDVANEVLNNCGYVVNVGTRKLEYTGNSTHTISALIVTAYQNNNGASIDELGNYDLNQCGGQP